jgi:hypothetical protein
MTTKGWLCEREVLVCLGPVGFINITFGPSQYIESPVLKTTSSIKIKIKPLNSVAL